MANIYLIELGMNDTLPEIVRKVNDNFRRLSANQSWQSKSEVRQEASRTDNAIAGILGEVNVAIANGLREIDTKVEQAISQSMDKIETQLAKDIEKYKKELEEKFNELASQAGVPEVGTYIMCDYDPNNQWPGTVWTRLSNIEIPTWKREE